MFFNLDGWIPVEDELPLNGDDVLVYTDEKDILSTVWYDAGEGVWMIRHPLDGYQEEYTGEIKYWMELPDEPTEVT